MAPSLPPLVQQMLQPGFYPHPVTEPIQLLQTHISDVFLTGDYAYKVKKPVQFWFLDFTTPAQRHHYCQEELRLNRRFAPALYLAVLPIIQHPATGQFTLGESGDISNLHGADKTSNVVDYALQMRQFDQASLFSHQLQQGKLTLAQVQTLGKQVAVHHQMAPTNATIQAYGKLSTLQGVDRNNYGPSRSFVGRTQTQIQLDQTQAFTQQFLADHGDWIQQRQTEGKIRECHGDLHLNNVCLYQDQIQVFDCIEFNPTFRNIDVMYDVAFMVMDLEFQGRVDLANGFLNAYLEHTGDYTGAALLPLYLSMRAYIRGNVNSLPLDDPAVADGEKQQFQDRAKAYYRLAWQYTQRPPGQLFLMSGLSGSGKSTVARQLAQRMNAIQIRSDAVRKHLAGLSPDKRGAISGNYQECIYTPEMTQKTYDRLLELGTLLVQQGWSVILDAKYDRQDLRQAVITQAEHLGIPVHILHCVAPMDVIRDRLHTRKGDISDATAQLLTAQQQAAEPFTAAEQDYVTSIDTDRDIDLQLSALPGVTPKDLSLKPVHYCKA